MILPNRSIKTIVHLADVHVRLFKRHTEYRKCFQELYRQLDATDLTQAVIVVVGDIVHAKTELSPEMVGLTCSFLTELADRAPTIVTVGNHDLNLANPSRLDSMSPLIGFLDHPSLHYFRDSGMYQVGDVEFGVFSILDSEDRWPVIPEGSAPTKIALYHGLVNNALLANGQRVKERQIDVATFGKYDIAMLGDLHRHQIVQDRDPIVVYPGSLIQQTHGETNDGHGWCEWDVASRTFKFHELPNEYGYRTLVVVDNKMPDIPALPPNVRLRLITQNTDTASIKKLLAILKRDHTIEECVVNRVVDATSPESFGRKMIAAVENVHQLDIQQRLLTEYLTPRLTDLNVLPTILEINERLNGLVQEEDVVRGSQWKPLRFEFSNMYSYGEDNVINFDQMDGVYGLFSPNASGKTAAFDALMFTLFDKTPRAFRAGHILNNRKKEFTCRLTFNLDGMEYGIQRHGVRKKEGEVKVDVDFWRVEADGTTTSLNGEDRRSTDAVIRRYIGTYEDFVMTNLSVQGQSSAFLDTGQAERKDLLSQFMGFKVFDLLYSLGSEEMKEVTALLKKFNTEPHAAQLAETQKRLQEVEAENLQYTKDAERWKTQISLLESTLDEQRAHLLPVDGSLDDLDVLEKELERFEEKLPQVDLRMKGLQDKILGHQASKADIERHLLESDYEKVEERYKLWQTLSAQLVDKRNKQQVIEERIRGHDEKLQKLSEHQYDPECEFCRNNAFVKDATASKEILPGLQQQIEELKRDQSTVEGQLTTLANAVRLHTQYQESQKELAKIGHQSEVLWKELSTVQSEREILLRNGEKLKERIHHYHQTLTALRTNAGWQEQIKQTEMERSEAQEEQSKVSLILRRLYGEMAVLKDRKAVIMKAIQDAAELEQTKVAFDHYLSAINRDGIPSLLIAKVLPTIETYVNDILTQIVDFTIQFEVDGRNVNGFIVYDTDRTWPLEMASGMERFIGSLAIRVALIQVSNLPKANFLIIDEGLGTLSAENLLGMQSLFTFLKAHFEFLVVISHLDVVRDMAESLLEIKRENGYSSIRF